MTPRSWIRQMFAPSVTRPMHMARARFRPALEALEVRTVPTTYHVTTLTDSVAGSLRDAIIQANTNAGPDTIDFQVTGTITLTAGELGVTDDLTITGPSVGLTLDAQGASRIFNVDDGTPADIAVSLSDLTLTGGSTADGDGGAIANAEDLSLTDCTLSSSSVSLGAGGGLFNVGTATLNHCTLSGNSAIDGGGLFNAGTATLTDCTLSGNSVSVGFGGGLFNSGTATLTKCTLAGNSAVTGFGGGLSNDGTATLTNCTLAGNAALFDGGGILNDGMATLHNSIVTNSPAGGDVITNGTLTGGHNLIGDGSGGLSDTVSGDPLLGSLQDNGGGVQTLALLPGSPAINAGTSTGAPANDQRGVVRIGNVDIGAFESRGFILAIDSGNSQTTALNTAFPNPLQVTVSSAFGEPVAGGNVTFTAPAGGASAALVGSPATINAAGQASITATANGTGGTYNVSAATSGAPASANFTLTNNEPPTITRNDAAVTLNEGSPATNAGTFDDDQPSSTVTLTASLGEVIKNDDGTWSWTHPAADGPAGPTTVTITATDTGGLTASTTFILTVNNVAPTATLSSNGPVNEASPATVSFSSPSDPSSDDTSAGFHYSIALSAADLATSYDAAGTATAATFTFADNGSYTVFGRIFDKDGGFTDATTTVVVNNVVPTIAISGAGSVNQSATYTLTLGAVTDPGTDTVTQYIVNWGDGTSTTYTTGGDKTHVYSDGPATRAITVDLVDEDGTHTNRANPLSVTVNNLAPTAAVSGPSGGVRGQPRSFTFSAGNLSSADQAAGLVYTIDWGDGSPLQTIDRTAGNGSGVTLEHIYTASGRYSVTATATDKDDATSSPVTHTLSIVAIQMQGNDLVVGGTTGNDAIAITAGAKGTVKARVGGVLPGSFSPTGKIVIYGQAGNDNIQVSNRVALPAWLYGDAGNDTLRGTNLADLLVGGAGNDVIHAGAGIDDVDGGDGNDLLLGAGGADLLAGGAGNDVIQAGAGEDWVDGSVGDDVINGGTGHDTLFGGSGHDRVNGGVGHDVVLGGEDNDTLTGSLGRDLLIGGLGGDRLMGHDADDLLIAGMTAFDGNQGALGAIMAEWTSGRSYAARVANLNGTGSGPRANGEVFLKSSGPNVTVFDDGAVDVLSGASGSDWYFANLSGGVLDTVSSVSGVEIVDEL